MNTTSPVKIVVLGAHNTKGAELQYLREQVEALGGVYAPIDTGLRPPPSGQAEDKALLMQNKAQEIIHRLTVSSVPEERTAYVAIGGGVGTWIALQVMKALPFGCGKVLVSTLPFDLRPDLAQSDIVVIPSIVDIQGLNPILRLALVRAATIAVALAGAAPLGKPGRRLVAITGLGITTDAVKHCQELLEAAGCEVATYHANGYGSRSLERAIREGAFAGVIDLTTHELNGLLFGSAAMPEPNRLTAAVDMGVPQVVCPGGLDILTRGPVSALTREEAQRPHYRHSPEFTHVRTTCTEMEQSARLLAARLSQGRGPCAVLIPCGGLSRADQPGSPLADPAGLAAFTAVLRHDLSARIAVTEHPGHINSPEFARDVVHQLLSLMPASP